jgi:hypothetical protein
MVARVEQAEREPQKIMVAMEELLPQVKLGVVAEVPAVLTVSVEMVATAELVAEEVVVLTEVLMERQMDMVEIIEVEVAEGFPRLVLVARPLLTAEEVLVVIGTVRERA